VYDNSTHQPVATPKAYGKSIKAADLPDGAARFFPTPSETSTQGLPPKLLLPILRGVRVNIAEIRDALARVELRMVGGSVLVIYEADWERAEEGLKQLEEGDADEEDDDEDEDGEEEAGEGSEKKKSRPYLAKLIDFAHTRMAPGEGPDEGVLKGLDTVLSLLDGRIAAVEQLV
jgi:1D-myo-inositol-tetrakisphosphate 5-kinase/inositol-polyphosphate multikinase